MATSLTSRVAISGAIPGVAATVGNDPWGNTWGGTWGNTWALIGPAVADTPASPAVDVTPRVGSVFVELALEGDEEGALLLEGDEEGELLLEGDAASNITRRVGLNG